MEEKKPYKSYKKTAKTTAYKPKRGKLAPLMTEEAKSAAGIHEQDHGDGSLIRSIAELALAV